MIRVLNKYLLFLLIISHVSCEKKQVQTEVEVEEIFEQTEDIILSEDEFIGELEQSLIDAGLVDIETIIPEVYVDLKYSTTSGL